MLSITLNINPLLAQAAGGISTATVFYIVAGMVMVVALLMLVTAFNLLQVLKALTRREAEDRARREGVALAEPPSWWAALWNRLNSFVPREKEGDLLMKDHAYDGIQELDNHLPPWWKWLLYGSIIWAAGYLIVYHVTNDLPLMAEEYENEVKQAAELKKQFASTTPAVAIDENTLSYSPEPAILAKGKQIFVNNCASCHKEDGGGNIGPNLTDEYWIHGAGIRDIFNVVKTGVIEKGMIAWSAVLSPEQIRDVSFYIVSIGGTNPPGAKAPQGEKYSETVPAPADTTGPAK
jgi:cytochrome c oxidase cbb3-type subunit 3